MKESMVFLSLVANFLSYAGDFYLHEIEMKVKSAVPEFAFYEDAYSFLDDDFFYKTSDFTPARRKEVFVHLFARNFGLRAWALYRQQLVRIGAVLYQTILHDRETRGLLAIADFNSLEAIDDGREVEIVIIDDED